MNYKNWLLPLTLSATFFAHSAQNTLKSYKKTDTLGLGILALKSASEYKGSDGKVYIFPYTSYQTQDFSITGTEAAVHLWGSGNWWVDGTASFRLQGFDEDLSEFTKGMEERKATIDLGASLNYYSSDFGYLSFDLKQDVGGVNRGHELTLNYAYPLSWGNLTITPGISIQRQSNKLVDYYYGVKETEVTTNRSAYSGEATINYSLSLDLEYALSQSLMIVSSAARIKLGDGIKNSPLIDNDEASWVTSVGFVYSF